MLVVIDLVAAIAHAVVSAGEAMHRLVHADDEAALRNHVADIKYIDIGEF
jgi:hypothetical protein